MCHLRLSPDPVNWDPRLWLKRTDQQAWMPDATKRKRHSIFIDPYMKFDSDGVVTHWQFPIVAPLGTHYMQVSLQSETVVGRYTIDS